MAISFASSPKCGRITSSCATLCRRKRSASVRAWWRSKPSSSSTLRPLISAASSVSRSMSVDAQVAQLVVVRDVARPRDDRQVREVLAHQLGHLDALLDVVDGQHHHARLVGAGGAQQVQPRRVAVEHRPAEAAHGLDLLGVVLEHGGREAVGVEQAADDLPVAAEAGDDHRRMLRLADLVELRSLRRARPGAAAHQRSAATSSSGVSSIEIATAATSSDEVGASITPAPAAVWNTTKPNSPPCASRMMNTGRSGQRDRHRAAHGPQHHAP